ncbi:MAG: GNAT family N-acetyltransferase [Pseudomonadota bacterium]
MSNKITIRILEQHEFAIWKAIRIESVKENPECFGGSYDEWILKEDAFWQKEIKNSTVFVCFDGDKAIGGGGYFFVDSKKLRHHATIFGVYLNQNYRGRKLVDLIINTIAEHAKKRDFEILFLAVVADNENAIRAYQRLGFSIYGTEPNHLKIDGTYFARHMMMKNL